MLFRSLAKKAKPEDITSLQELAQGCLDAARSGNSGAAFEADGLFHLEIAKRCGNPYIYSILKNLEAKIQLIRMMNCSPKIIISDIKIHNRIIEAIEANDPKTASALMQKHIGNFIDHTSPQSVKKRRHPAAKAIS